MASRPTSSSRCAAHGYGASAPTRSSACAITASPTIYVGELRALGYAGLAADEIVRLRDHGVMPDFIREANRGGGRHTPEELVRLRTGG